MNASSGESWSEDISDLTNEIAHGRTVAEVSFAGLPRECFVRNDRAAELRIYRVERVPFHGVGPQEDKVHPMPGDNQCDPSNAC